MHVNFSWEDSYKRRVLLTRWTYSVRQSCVKPYTDSIVNMREIVHIQAGQCGNQIGAKVILSSSSLQFSYEFIVSLQFHILYLHFSTSSFCFFCSFGKLSLMNMESIQQEHITETQIFNWKELTSTITKQPVKLKRIFQNALDFLLCGFQYRHALATNPFIGKHSACKFHFVKAVFMLLCRSILMANSGLKSATLLFFIFVNKSYHS